MTHHHPAPGGDPGREATQEPEWLTPDEARFTFVQDGDSRKDGYQSLSVAVVDDGGGHYLILRTARWAIDPDDLPKLIETLRRCVAQCERRDSEGEGQADDPR